MSNLSELLPAGGSSKEFEAVATGALPNGQTVVLQSDGTVKAVGETSISQSIPSGSGAQFDSGSSHDGIMTAYDPTTAGRFAVVYLDANNSSHGTIAIGQVSGTSITFGASIVFMSAWSHNPRISWSPKTSGQLAIATGRASQGRIVIGNVSGTGVTFGAESIFFNSGIPDHYDMAFDPITANRLVVAFRRVDGSGYGTAVAGTVSGTAVTFGSPVVFRATNVQNVALSFDPNTANQFVVSYGMQVNSGYGQAQIGTLSGTNTLSFGSQVTTTLGASAFNAVSYDQKTAGKFYAAFQDSTTSDRGTAVCCTVSGTTISVGQMVVFNTGSSQYISIAGDPNTANQCLISYRDNGNSGHGTAIIGTVPNAAGEAGTVMTFASEIVYSPVNATVPGNVVFDSFNPGQFVVNVSNPTGRAVLGQIADDVTNLTSTNFLGTSTAAFADGETATVIPVGGVAVGVSNIAMSIPVGAETVYNVGSTYSTQVSFDPNNASKCVIVYTDSANSNAGTAIVGTLSGTTITFGTEVVFNSASSDSPSVAFDPSTSGKFVVTYMDEGNSNAGTAIVGTLSGTTVSFGTAVVFDANSRSSKVEFDPNNAGKLLIVYRDWGAGGYGKAIIGTMSGSSLSFGTASFWASRLLNFVGLAIDPSTSKFVITYKDQVNSDYGRAVVGAISGTSVSFGSDEYINLGATSYTAVSFDPNTANKCVIVFKDTANSDYGTARVATVSGTGISFGPEVVFNAGNTNYPSIDFDPNIANRCLISYRDTSNSGYATVIVGTVSGTGISFGSEVVISSGAADVGQLKFDPNTANRFIVTYTDYGNSNSGTAIVGNISTALTIGSTYYVQGNGTVSTVSTSPAVQMGKAISTTSMILKGNS